MTQDLSCRIRLFDTTCLEAKGMPVARLSIHTTNAAAAVAAAFAVVATVRLRQRVGVHAAVQRTGARVEVAAHRSSCMMQSSQSVGYNDMAPVKVGSRDHCKPQVGYVLLPDTGSMGSAGGARFVVESVVVTGEGALSVVWCGAWTLGRNRVAGYLKLNRALRAAAGHMCPDRKHPHLWDCPVAAAVVAELCKCVGVAQLQRHHVWLMQPPDQFMYVLNGASSSVKRVMQDVWIAVCLAALQAMWHTAKKVMAPDTGPELAAQPRGLHVVAAQGALAHFWDLLHEFAQGANLSLALGVVYCHMICPSCISLVLPVDCRSIMYIGCLLFDVALCMHVLAFPQSGSQEICLFTLTLAARVTTVPSQYAHTSACSTRNMQAAVDRFSQSKSCSGYGVGWISPLQPWGTAGSESVYGGTLALLQAPVSGRGVGTLSVCWWCRVGRNRGSFASP
jgi:hypothetical protein